MEREELCAFYSLILPEAPGYYVFAKLPLRSHQHFPTLKSFTSTSCRKANKPGSYHACSKYLYPKGREGKDVVAVRSLWLDIDIRDKPDCYHTREEALKELTKLESIYGQSLIVWSGSGLHVYWPFERDVTPEEWQVLAKQLDNNVRRLGVKVDGARTCDIASILRVPGSLNEKYGVLVEILQWPESLYNADVGLAQSPSTQYLQSKAVPTAVLPEQYAISTECLTSVCKQIDYLQKGTLPHAHDPWFYCATILKFIPNGEDTFYRWSKNQYGLTYEPELATKKIETASAPTSCEAFGRAEQGYLCQGCKFRGKGLNPIKAALRTTALQHEGLPQILPDGWEYRNNSISMSKQGTFLAVSHRPIWVDGLIRDEDNENHYVRFRFQDANKKSLRSFMLSSKEASNFSGSAINAKGVGVLASLWPIYLRDSQHFYETLCVENDREPTMTLVKKFGWSKLATTGQAFFVFGYDSVSEDQIGYHAIDENDARMVRYAKAMKLDTEPDRAFKEWQSLIHELLGDINTPLGVKLSLLLSFVAPLVYLAGHRGFGGIIFNTYGKSGSGKTTGLMAAASVWGRFDDYVMPTNSSLAALYSDVVARPHLPFIIDEINLSPWGNDPQSLHSWAKSWSMGQGPGRATQTGGMREIGQFSTIAITSSNEPLTGIIRSIPNLDDAWATEKRVIEVEAALIDAKVNLDYKKLMTMGGTAGRKWIRHILQPEVMQDFNHHVATWDHPGIGRQDRFLFSLIMLMVWADKQLGLADIVWFGEDIVTPFIISQMEHIKEGAPTMHLTRAQEAIVEFIDKDERLVYEKIPAGKVGKNAEPENTSCATWQGNKIALCCYVIENKTYYCRPTELRAHLKKSLNKSGSEVLATLKREGVCDIGRCNINGRKENGDASRDCYMFPESIINLWRDILLRKEGDYSHGEV